MGVLKSCKQVARQVSNVLRDLSASQRFVDLWNDLFSHNYSHHPSCHKRSLVNTLLRRARNIPSTLKGKREEAKRVKAVLRETNYSSSFINQSCKRALSDPPTTTIACNGFVVIPSLAGHFGKDWPRPETTKGQSRLQATNHHQQPLSTSESAKGRRPAQIGHSIQKLCTNCVVYYGQTERQLKTWIVEHKKAVSLFHYNSMVACHVYENSCHMDFSYVKVVGQLKI